MEELCKNCGHSKSSHPTCSFCDCQTFESNAQPIEEINQIHGPVSEVRMDDWCVDCGHHKKLHNLNEHEKICKYWTDQCTCEGFVSRTEALIAVRKSGGFISRTEVIQAIRKLEENVREGI